jgi:hypothetical protein
MNNPVETKLLTKDQFNLLLDYHNGYRTDLLPMKRNGARCRICGDWINKGEMVIKTYTDFTGQSNWNEPSGMCVQTIYVHEKCK